MKIAVAGIVLSLLLGSCEFKASVNSGEELKGEGITFIVPKETSSSSQGTGGISYASATVKAKTDGRKLMVDDKDYGPLASGDKVDFREKGKVLVNGTERKSVTP